MNYFSLTSWNALNITLLQGFPNCRGKKYHLNFWNMIFVYLHGNVSKHQKTCKCNITFIKSQVNIWGQMGWAEAWVHHMKYEWIWKQQRRAEVFQIEICLSVMHQRCLVTVYCTDRESHIQSHGPQTNAHYILIFTYWQYSKLNNMTQ